MLQKKISEYHWKLVQLIFLIFSFTLPFSIKLSNIVLFIMAALLLLRVDILRQIWEVRRFPLILPYLFLFLTYVISILWSNNSRVAGFTIEKHLALLILPITLFANFDKIRTSQISKILYAFVWGTFASYIYLFVRFLFLKTDDHTLTLSYFFRELAVNYVQLHPTYQAMYTIFSISILLVKIVKHPINWQSAFYILVVLVLCIFCLLTGARMPLIALFVILLAILYLALQSSKHFKITALISGVFLVGMVFLVPQFEVFKSRIKEIKETPLEPPIGIHFNSINLRVAQLLCSKNIILDNWLLGVGVGDTQDQLNNCYCKNNWSPALYERNYNAHNQYLQTFIGTGIIGLLLFLGILFIPLWYSIKSRNVVLTILIFLFSFCCITESMLEKNKGIIFYTFFSLVLLAKSNQNSNSDLKISNGI